MSTKEEKEEKKNLFYTPHKNQEEFHRCKTRFRVGAIGRQFGKTLMTINEVVIELKKKPGALWWWVSFRYRITMVGFKYARNQFGPIIRRVDKKKMEIEFENGSILEFKSTRHWDDLVGEPLDGFVVDEAGRIPEGAIYESLMPTLTVTKGKAIFIGTPKGKNWFHKMFLMGKDKKYPEYTSFQHTSYDNPYADINFINSRKKDTPDRIFRQEYLAKFLDNIGAVFKNVDMILDDNIQLIALPKQKDHYIMGLDLAKEVDWTVITILNQRGELVYYDRFHQEDWSSQIDKIITIACRFNCKVYADNTGVGAPVVDMLRKAGIEVEGLNFSGNKKRDLIDALNISISNLRIRIPDCEETELLLEELRCYEYDLNEHTGKIKFGAQYGKHDDSVISLALASYGLFTIRPFSIADIRLGRHFNDPNNGYNSTGAYKNFKVLPVRQVGVING